MILISNAAFLHSHDLGQILNEDIRELHRSLVMYPKAIRTFRPNSGKLRIFDHQLPIQHDRQAVPFIVMANRFHWPTGFIGFDDFRRDGGPDFGGQRFVGSVPVHFS